jgi:hypothetical protein
MNGNQNIRTDRAVPNAMMLVRRRVAFNGDGQGGGQGRSAQQLFQRPPPPQACRRLRPRQDEQPIRWPDIG